MSAVSIFPLNGMPAISPGDDLARLVGDAIVRTTELQTGDVVVVCQKIVSKAEGRIVRLEDVVPGEDVRIALFYKHPGETIKVKARRRDEELEFNVRLQ